MTRACLMLALWFATATACGPTSPSPDSDHRRIVCLVPAVSRMIVDLGLAEQIVGVAEYDALAGDGRPVVGNFASVDTEQLLALSPDVVITLRSKDSPSARLRDLADRGAFELIALPYPSGIEAVADMLSQPGPSNDLGDYLATPERAASLRQRMLDRLDAVRTRTADAEPQSVLMCIGLAPVMASGPGTVNDRLLDYIHATNAAADATVTAPTFDREMLLAMQPDVIVLMMPGAPPLVGMDDHRLAEFAGLSIPAVEQERIHLINDPHCLLPSTNLPDVAEALAEAVHGITVEPEPGDE